MLSEGDRRAPVDESGGLVQNFTGPISKLTTIR